MDFTYNSKFDVTPAVRDLLESDRERGHVHVMSAFRTRVGESPRSKLGVLWHIDPTTRVLAVRASEAPIRPGLLGEPRAEQFAPSVAHGLHLEVHISLGCLKTPVPDISPGLGAEIKRSRSDLKSGKCYRSRPIVVPELERDQWAVRRLATAGLRAEVEDIGIGALRYASLGSRGRGIPFVDLRARAVIADEDLLAEKLAQGLGRGRNYGLGMIRLLAKQPAP